MFGGEQQRDQDNGVHKYCNKLNHGNDIWLYFVELSISLTILSYRGCKSGIPTSDFDEFLLPEFS